MLRDPDACPQDGPADTHVIRVSHVRGYIRRRHECRICGRRWRSYQSLLDPHDFDPNDVDPAMVRRYP